MTNLSVLAVALILKSKPYKFKSLMGYKVNIFKTLKYSNVVFKVYIYKYFFKQKLS